MKKIFKIYNDILTYIAVIGLVGFLACVTLQVGARVFLPKSPNWTEEAARFLFIFMVAFAGNGVSQENMDYLAKSASDIWPYIKKADYIRNYSGILPKWTDEQGAIQDWRIERRDDIAPYAVNLIGIESPGLTAAVPIARYVIELMKEKEAFVENPSFNPVRKGIKRFEQMSEEERRAAIEADPDYGEVICRCQKVTKAEILKAIHNPLGVSTMVGIKYRTRSMMGRCQGGYCQMRIEQMIETELGKAAEEVVYNRQGAYVLTGKVRKEGQ